MNWIKSFLKERKQMISVSGNISSDLEIDVGTPQGSRLSPLLFICLMADMDLWIENSKLSNFTDDTQSIIIHDNIEDAIEITKKEANNIIDFFGGNNLVNNPDKAALLFNSKGKGRDITVHDIGGENLTSTYSEKLLGLHLVFYFKLHSYILLPFLKFLY